MGFPWEQSPGVYTVRAALVTGHFTITTKELEDYIKEHDLEEERDPLPVKWDPFEKLFIAKEREHVLYGLACHQAGFGLVRVRVEGPEGLASFPSTLQERESIEEEELEEEGNEDE